ncbi:MAG TPA: alpha/beta fold hydrolase [Gemmatimonadaceae bacterium]|nr:alpha/beta fold hydrolase [Gemmatimonadaceae bacterium]
MRRADVQQLSPSWRTEATPSGLALRVCEPAEPRHPPLLLIHGFAGASWYWERWQGFLAARGRPTAALDLRGRPGSRPVADLGRVTLADYVADASEAARFLGRPAVVGHSMGGLLAQKLAEADLVSALVLLCSMPPRGIFFAQPRLVLHQVRHLWAMIAGRPITPGRDEMEEIVLNRMPPDERLALADDFQQESGTVARELSLGGLAVDARRVRCPTLVVSAEHDRFFAPRVAREVAERYGVRPREYAGHAHFLVMEPGWERVAAEVEGWVGEMEETARATRRRAHG